MPFGLYLHFPFCKNICSYCDFYKRLHDGKLEHLFYNALARETELVAESLKDAEREISTLYIGGGTPSLGSLPLFANWLYQVRSLFHLPIGIEFSFEANPESVDRELLEGLIELGVNRPVFGIQSFQADRLAMLGRKHNIHDSHRAVYLAGALGFPTFGVDLIFALPKQTAGMFSADLDQLINLDPPHISLYQLTVESGTVLAGMVERGKLKEAGDDLIHAMYRGSFERLIEAGYARYEVCSYAKSGHECSHNLGYWQGGDYVGLGPSAHSFVDGQRFANVRDLDEYISVLGEGRRPLVLDESGEKERIAETIMLGLRTAEGIDRKRFRNRFGSALTKHIDQKQLNLLVAAEHVESDTRGIRLSDDGMFLLDEIVTRLMR